MGTTALILGILDTQAKLISTLVASQSPAQQQILWDRYIQLTQPLHDLLVKVEGLAGHPAPAAQEAPKP